MVYLIYSRGRREFSEISARDRTEVHLSVLTDSNLKLTDEDGSKHI